MKKKLEYQRPGEPNITHANISKAKIKLGWKPVLTLEKGIGRFWKILTIGKMRHFGIKNL